ncbi:AAA family ATPase [Roseiconus lacunae]|uniref:AAA family ATPase n=1 Tax=Roseiconus lacunae TaxID=2605694 RepID=UPI00308DE4BA|nr:AAA family ATPase [Stieleria sp. HD01]
MHTLSIPTQYDSPLEVFLAGGQSLFVAGPNGAGKSSLMQHLCAQHHEVARRISAHRQTWFSSETSNITAQTKKQTEQNILATDRQPDSRWKDDYAAQRAGIAIYDLIDAENVRARRVTAAVDADDLTLAKSISNEPAPIAIINHLLKLANLPLVISVEESERVMASKNGSQPFSIAQLSDGERNALLIAANVLTVQSGSLILIDEPERHLHRSIISPLLTHLFATRQDCTFVISTHEVMLCTDHLESSTLLVRGCTFDGRRVTRWDADLVSADDDVPEDVKIQVLGSRRKLLFVEGTQNSLDTPMYSLVLPDCSVIPTANCREVEQCVKAIRNSASLHWVSACGIIDNDARSPDELLALQADGVFALECFSVESLYYDPEIIRLVAIRQAVVQDYDAESVVAEAIQTAVSAILLHITRLASRVAEKTVRHKMLCAIPSHQNIRDGDAVEFSLDVASILQEEENRISQLLRASNFREVLRRYPIRETPAFGAIAKRLRFCGRSDYERAVLKLVADDNSARTKILGMLGDLPNTLNS